jgi:transposase
MKNDIAKIFHLQAFWIRDLRIDPDRLEIIIELKKKHRQCPRCGTKSGCCHQLGKLQTVKHQLWGKQIVYLKGRKDRWKCRRCKKPFTEVWPGVKKWSRKSEEAEYQILELLRGKSFRQLEQENKVSDHEARYLLLKIATAPNWQEEKRLPRIKLGVDEHSFRGKDLVTTITNLSQRRLKAILPDDRQASLRQWLREIPTPIKRKISEVCIDMRELFRSVLEQELPKASIVVDHFHVIKDANHRLEVARRLEQEMQGRKHIGKRWWFIKGREKLKDEEKQALDKLLERYPELKAFYYFKEQLRLFYKAKNREEAAILLSRIILNMECSDDAAINQWGRTIKRWRTYILNYFISRTTNAFTEGSHTKIKMIKRLSYGFRNVQIYIRKMMLAFIPIGLLGGLIWHTYC